MIETLDCEAESAYWVRVSFDQNCRNPDLRVFPLVCSIEDHIFIYGCQSEDYFCERRERMAYKLDLHTMAINEYEYEGSNYLKMKASFLSSYQSE